MSQSLHISEVKHSKAQTLTNSYQQPWPCIQASCTDHSLHFRPPISPTPILVKINQPSNGEKEKARLVWLAIFTYPHICHAKPLGPDQNRSNHSQKHKFSCIVNTIIFPCSTHLFVMSLAVLLKKTITCCLFLQPRGWCITRLAEVYRLPCLQCLGWPSDPGLTGHLGRASTHPGLFGTIPAYACCPGITLLSKTPWFRLSGLPISKAGFLNFSTINTELDHSSL